MSTKKQEAISATLTGRKNGPPSPEHVEKIRKATLGRKFTEEHKQNLKLGWIKRRARTAA